MYVKCKRITDTINRDNEHQHNDDDHDGEDNKNNSLYYLLLGTKNSNDQQNKWASVAIFSWPNLHTAFTLKCAEKRDSDDDDDDEDDNDDQ